jgi:hypothetical protein
MYNIPENEKMHKTICETVRQDSIVQWLASTPLKRDQFKFIYEIHEIVYKCALRDDFIALNFDEKERNVLYNSPIFTKVIPMLTVLKAMLRIRDIDDKKQADAKHEEQMKLRMTTTYFSAFKKEEEEETKEEETKKMSTTGMKQAAAKKKKVIEIDPEELERLRKEAEFKAELKKYGVSVNWH